MAYLKDGARWVAPFTIGKKDVENGMGVERNKGFGEKVYCNLSYRKELSILFSNLG